MWVDVHKFIFPFSSKKNFIMFIFYFIIIIYRSLASNDANNMKSVRSRGDSIDTATSPNSPANSLRQERLNVAGNIGNSLNGDVVTIKEEESYFSR